MSEHEHTAEHTDGHRPGIWEAGRHPVNTGQLVMGLAFLGMVALWALWATEAVEGGDVRWLLPVPFVVAGGIGLVATAISGAAHRDRWRD